MTCFACRPATGLLVARKTDLAGHERLGEQGRKQNRQLAVCLAALLVGIFLVVICLRGQRALHVRRFCSRANGVAGNATVTCARMFTY